MKNKKGISGITFQVGDIVRLAKDFYEIPAGAKFRILELKSPNSYKLGSSRLYSEIVVTGDYIVHAETNEVQEKIELYLDKKQQNKQFKDVGDRVGGSRKEMAAFQVVRFSDLPELEADEITARKLVVKDKVYPKVDIDREIELGTSSAATYIKVKFREACVSQPIYQPKKSVLKTDDATKRAVYVKFLDWWVSELDTCRKVDDILGLIDTISNWKIKEFVLKTINPNLDSLSDEELIKIASKYDIFEKYYFDRFKFIKEQFGSEFYNLLTESRGRFGILNKVWAAANSFESIDEEKSKILTAKAHISIDSKIAYHKARIEEYEIATKADLNRLFKNWTGIGHLKGNLEAFRQVAIQYHTKLTEQEESNKVKAEIENKPRPENWDWLGRTVNLKLTKADQEIKEPTINSGVEQVYYRRVGGLKIEDNLLKNLTSTDLSLNPITGMLGLKSIQFGNSLDDREASIHTKRFLASIIDLAEILNLNVKQLNEKKGLSIAFAARGKGKAMAHYEAGRKIINLTKRRGDGTVCHEFAHYLDNFSGLEFMSDKVASNRGFDSVYSDVFSNNLQNLMKFIYSGFNEQPQISKRRIKAQNTNSKYTLRWVSSFDGYNYSEKIETKKDLNDNFNIQATIDYYKETGCDFLFQVHDDPKNAQIQDEILAKFVFDCGIEFYEFPVILKYYKRRYLSSQYYYYSSKLRSDYWIRPHELFARAFEAYVYDKLRKAGRENNYLVSDNMELRNFPIQSGQIISVYPEGDEREEINRLFDLLIDSYKVYHGITSFVPYTAKREDEYYEYREENHIKDKKMPDRPDKRNFVISARRDLQSIRLLRINQKSKL